MLFSGSSRQYAINNPTPLGAQRFCFVFHQVRHPMRVVSSIVKSSTKPWDRFWDWLVSVEPKVGSSHQRSVDAAVELVP
jgi:hypothetical protein